MKQTEFLKRVALVQQDFFATVYTSSAPDRLYINEVINTLIALLQLPVFFGLFKQTDNGLKLIYRSTLDSKINETLEQVSYCSTCNQCIWCESVFIPINIGKNIREKFLIKIIRAETDTKEYQITPVKRDSEHPADRYIWRCMSFMFESAQKSWAHLLNGQNNIIFWKTIIDSIPESQTSNEPYRRPKIRFNGDENAVKSVTDELSQHLNKAFDKLDKTAGFIRDIYSKSEISNYFMAVNLNAADLNRFSRPDLEKAQNKVHNYTLTMLLGKEQRKEIEGYFSSVHKAGMKAFKGRLYNSFAMDEPSHRELINSMDDWFWQNITQDNHKQLTDAFTFHLGQSAQSFCDLVVESGISYIRYPYANSGLHLLNHHQLDKITHISQAEIALARELQRITVTHYVVSAMAPSEPQNSQDKLIILLNPLEVAGTTWAVIGHVLYVDEYFAKNCQEWNAKFNYITTVRRKIARNVQKQLQELHLAQLETVYAEVFLKLFIHSAEQISLGDPLNDHQKYRFLQKKTLETIRDKNLHLYLPYRIPMFTKEGEFDLAQGSAYSDIVNYKWSLMNSFYEQPHLRERKYLSENSFKRMLDRAYILATLKYLNTEEKPKQQLAPYKNLELN